MCKVDPFGGIISLLLSQLFAQAQQPFALWSFSCTPHPLIVYVYTTFTPIHLFLFSFLPLTPSRVIGRNICTNPSRCDNSCRGIERDWMNGVNKWLHKGYPFILLSVTEGMKSLFKLIAWPPLCCTWQRLLCTMQLRSRLEKNKNNTGSPLSSL